MPYELKPPKAGVTPYWQVRGRSSGIYCKRSTQTRDKREAQQILKAWREEAKRLSISGPKREAVTFASAAISYMQSGRPRLFLAPLIEHFGETPLDEIDQRAIDGAAAILGPNRAPQTNNRLVYTPTIAILRHAGIASTSELDGLRWVLTAIASHGLSQNKHSLFSYRLRALTHAWERYCASFSTPESD